jgi:hypothetical protein
MDSEVKPESVLPQSRLKNNHDQNFDRIFNRKPNLFKMILIAFRRPKNHFWEIFVFVHFVARLTRIVHEKL